jgi:predicted dehydrogenase
MKRCRIGISGAGFGARVHLPALQNHPRFEVVAIASPRSAAEVARSANVPHSFRSTTEMLEGCELDAVTVASPPFAHREDVDAALRAGKNVMCEKPFALRIADAEAMVEAAKRAGTACGVTHEFRFVPQAQALKELAVNGHLGALRNLEITLLRLNLRRHEPRPRSWWFERESGGGLTGAVLGFRRTANPERLDATGSFTSTVDDGAFALLDYGDGTVARLTADATASVESYACALHGERRTAVASGPTILDVQLYISDAEETDELECTPPPYARYAKLGPDVPPLMELYDEFARAIEGEPNVLPSFGEALETQRVLAAIGYEH